MHLPGSPAAEGSLLPVRERRHSRARQACRSIHRRSEYLPVGLVRPRPPVKGQFGLQKLALDGSPTRSKPPRSSKAQRRSKSCTSKKHSCLSPPYTQQCLANCHFKAMLPANPRKQLLCVLLGESDLEWQSGLYSPCWKSMGSPRPSCLPPAPLIAAYYKGSDRRTHPAMEWFLGTTRGVTSDTTFGWSGGALPGAFESRM